uniref:Uncharacterized protein n=1 Tax=Rhodnius prolixus TaxID=13249 RepID=T1HZN9_RHOPR
MPVVMMIEAIPLDDKHEENFNQSFNKPLYDLGNTKLDDLSKSYLQKLIDELSKPKNEIQDCPVIKDEKFINKIMELQKLHQKIEEKNKSRIQFTMDNRLGAMLPTKIEEPKRKVEKKIGEIKDRQKCIKEKDRKKCIKEKDRRMIDKEDLRMKTVEEKPSALQILKKRFHNKQCGTENSKDKKICGNGGGRKVSWCGVTTRTLKLTPMASRKEEENFVYDLKPLNERSRKTDISYEDGDKKTMPAQETTSALKQPEQDERGKQRRISIKPHRKADTTWQRIMKKIKRKK